MSADLAENRRLIVLVAVLVFCGTFAIGFPVLGLIIGNQQESLETYPIVASANASAIGSLTSGNRNLTTLEGIAVQPGRRAVTIVVDQRTAVEGFASSGKRVDVVRTWVDRGGNLKSEIIALNAKVLSLKGRVSESEKVRIEGRVTATLEVDAVDALRIIESAKLSLLSLLLRSETDRHETGRLEVKDDLIARAQTGTSMPSHQEAAATPQKKYCPSKLGSKVPVGTLKYPKEYKVNPYLPEALFTKCLKVRLP